MLQSFFSLGLVIFIVGLVIFITNLGYITLGLLNFWKIIGLQTLGVITLGLLIPHRREKHFSQVVAFDQFYPTLPYELDTQRIIEYFFRRNLRESPSCPFFAVEQSVSSLTAETNRYSRNLGEGPTQYKLNQVNAASIQA